MPSTALPVRRANVKGGKHVRYGQAKADYSERFAVCWENHCGQKLFYAYKNGAHLDDDWVWMVNPFSIDDPRNQYGFKNMSFVLSNYLLAGFDYVIFSSVRMMHQTIREAVFQDITAEDYLTIGFSLTCSEKTLAQRHQKRGDDNELSFEWLRLPPLPNDFVIDTDNKTVSQIAAEIKSHIDETDG